ncbi:hypothetical protein Tco_0299923 [Tanacetum coccineum]
MTPENKEHFLSEKEAIFLLLTGIGDDIYSIVDAYPCMMSDHNSSDLTPQRQEMSVENVSSGLIPQGQKASDYDNSDPVPPRQNVVPTTEKIDSSQQGLEFLFSPLHPRISAN